MRKVWFTLWGAGWLAVLPVPPAGAEAMTPTETLTCGAVAAEVAAFEHAHPGAARVGMPRYRAIVALLQGKVPGAGTREIAAALDDTLIDGAGTPDAMLLDLLARHRIAGDDWRA